MIIGRVAPKADIGSPPAIRHFDRISAKVNCRAPSGLERGEAVTQQLSSAQRDTKAGTGLNLVDDSVVGLDQTRQLFANIGSLELAKPIELDADELFEVHKFDPPTERLGIGQDFRRDQRFGIGDDDGPRPGLEVRAAFADQLGRGCVRDMKDAVAKLEIPTPAPGVVLIGAVMGDASWSQRQLQSGTHEMLHDRAYDHYAAHRFLAQLSLGQKLAQGHAQAQRGVGAEGDRCGVEVVARLLHPEGFDRVEIQVPGRMAPVQQGDQLLHAVDAAPAGPAALAAEAVVDPVPPQYAVRGHATGTGDLCTVRCPEIRGIQRQLTIPGPIHDDEGDREWSGRGESAACDQGFKVS